MGSGTGEGPTGAAPRGGDRMRRWTGGTEVVSCPVGGRHVDKEIRDRGRGRERLEKFLVAEMELSSDAFLMEKTAMLVCFLDNKARLFN